VFETDVAEILVAISESIRRRAFLDRFDDQQQLKVERRRRIGLKVDESKCLCTGEETHQK
jgi:hypothetical protein